MSSLRRRARGRACFVRLPGVCNGNPETVVLAHIRRAAAGGVSAKPPDICGVYACSDCHDAMDGRTRLDPALAEVLDRYVLDALLRTLVSLYREGLVS